MNPPKSETTEGWTGRRADAKSSLRIEKNARKAKESADRLFPDEAWKQVENGIFLSPHRPIGKKSNYKNELQNAQILRDLGNTVYLAPERKDATGKQPDAIVNGLMFEFKNVCGMPTRLLRIF